VLTDGKDDFFNQNLLIEMKYTCKFENILNKEGSLRAVTVKKLVQVESIQSINEE